MSANLAKALLNAQQHFPTIPMDSKNPHFGNKFASLGAILHKVLPVLNENGLTLLQHPTVLEGQPALRTKLIHAESGEFEEDTMLLVLDKQNSQGQGSALSYARRYAVMSTLGLVADEDDDGAAASKPRKAKPKSSGSGSGGDVSATTSAEEASVEGRSTGAQPDPDFATQPDPPSPEVLAEIREIASRVVTTAGTADLQAELSRLNWREDATDAMRAVAKLRIWDEEQKA